MVEKYLDIYTSNTIGLYGRSSGWFGIESNIAGDIENLLSDLENMSVSEAYENYFIDDILHEVDAIEWLLSKADSYNKGMKFGDCVLDNLNYLIEEICEEVDKNLDIKKAKKLVEKHGFVVGKIA